jgi:hypothetical protein
MTQFKQFTTIKHLVTLVTVWVLLFGFLCVGIFEASADAQYADAPIISEQIQDGCCNESLTGHFAVWKNIALSTTQDLGGYLLAFAMAVVVLLVFFPETFRARPDLYFLRYKTYKRNHLEVRTYDPLRLAFARGTLHPKTF